MYSGDFDATNEYLMNQVQHHQVTQQLNIASVGSGAPGRLCTRDDQGNSLEMPLIAYLPEDWTQLSSSQNSSIRKCCTVADGEQCRTCCGGHTGCGSSGGNRKRQCKNRRNHDPKSAEFCALTKFVAILSKNVNVMATHMSGQSDKDSNAKPAADGKMASNSHNSALCKTPKMEKE